jgi:hypothetical protein
MKNASAPGARTSGDEPASSHAVIAGVERREVVGAVLGVEDHEVEPGRRERADERRRRDHRPDAGERAAGGELRAKRMGVGHGIGMGGAKLTPQANHLILAQPDPSSPTARRRRDRPLKWPSSKTTTAACR